MSTQRERLMESISTSGDGHAVKLSQAEEVTPPKQGAGLTLGEVEQKPLGEIKINESNAGQFKPLNGEEFERLKADIQERGILVPLIVKKDGTLLAGHNRLNAAIALGLKSVPVQRLSNPLTAAQEKAFVIKDNLLRRQLKPDEQAKMLADLYPETFNSTGKGKRKRDTVSLLDVAREHGLKEKQVKRAKETHQRAKAMASKSGKAKPDLEDYEKASAEKNAQRRAKESAKPASDRTGKAQKGATGQGNGQGRADGEAALIAFNSALNDALKKVEMQPASVLKIAVRHAKSWLKDVERKHKAAERAK